MLKLIERLKKEDLRDYQSIPFWSWNNKLNIKELQKQIRLMKKAGHGGFIMHARTGLKTEYLSDEWFDCISAGLSEAKKLNMNAWIYDENGWPSGFAGGMLLQKENLAKYLSYEIKDFFDKNALAVYNLIDGEVIKIDQNTRLEKYHTIYLNLSPANTDILDGKVVDKFIKITYDEYYKRFGSSFGKELTGFFTDEPQYFRYATPYTTDAETEFKRLYNENLFDGLLYLFIESEKGYPFRVKYYNMLNYLYTENFYNKIYMWCKEHNCKLTGHSVEENKLFAQMWGCAGCSTSYEYEHIPGIDNLGKYSSAQLSARQVASVSMQLGKKQILTETFGCCGYDSTPRELKNIAEKQYVHGVNLMCQHLMPYSMAGQGKVDHPPCFGPQMGWWKEYRLFNDYFTRLGYLLASSKELTKVAVINPMQSVFLKYFRDNEKESLEFDNELEKLQDILAKYNINYHFIDETILGKYGKVEGDSLTVGNYSYKYIIIPHCLTLSSSTAGFLRQYLLNSGKVYCYGKPEYLEGAKYDYSFLKSNCDLEEVKKSGFMMESDGKIAYTYRILGQEKFLYILNQNDAETSVSLPEGSYSMLDLQSLKLYKTDRKFKLQKNESILITEEKTNQSQDVFTKANDITKDFVFSGCSKNSLIVDKISISYDGKDYSPASYVYEVFERLVKANYRGKLYVKYSFTVNDLCNLTLFKEKDKSKSLKVNGKDIKFKQSKFDVNFIEADISGCVKKGVNEFTFTIDYIQDENLNYALFDKNATESLRNCLAFRTEIESIYIEGNFELNSKYEIVAPKYNIDKGNIEKSGYPFFAGEFIFKARVNSASAKAKLKIDGNFTVANVIVNGKRYAGAVLSNEVLLNNLSLGENEITLTVKSSLRNKFGAHHAKVDENWGISPFNFNLRGTWNNGASEFYDEKYNIVKFGIDKVQIEY